MATLNEDQLKATYNYLNNPINYVSGGDGELYIDNVLVDECYDIQYSYREMKEPIYGYRSKYFSAVLEGTVLITGQFTINYIHDGYLYSILNADKSIAPLTDGRNIANNNVFPSLLKDGFNKKTALQQYSELRKYADTLKQKYSDSKVKIDILKQSVLELDKKLEAANNSDFAAMNNIAAQESSWKSDMWSSDAGKAERVANAQREYDSYKTRMDQVVSMKNMIASGDILSVKMPSPITSISLQADFNTLFRDLAEVTDEADIPWIANRLLSLIEAYRRESEELIQPGYFNSDTNNYAKLRNAEDAIFIENSNNLENINKQKASLKEKIAELESKAKDVESIEQQLEAMRIKLSSPDTSAFMVESGNYKSIETLKLLQAQQRSDFTSNQRPENVQRGNVNFQIKFNGLQHKLIQSVHLVGHTHFFGVGGEVIKETYTFLAKKLG